jgi:cation:H+ antiporter
MTDLAFILGAVLLAAAGGEAFLRSILGTALHLRGATGIAAAFAVDTYVIGVVLLAIGMSLPELVTVILSRLLGHDDVGVGTLISSNLFNGLAIVGVAGTIHPIVAPITEVALTLACGIVLATLTS